MTEAIVMKETKKRVRRYYSLKNALLLKAKEAALAAVQIFNSPTITFKSEIFIVLMQIAWTYLLHAYFKEKGVDYRYYEQNGRRKKFIKTNDGDFKYWELSQCLKQIDRQISDPVKENIRFLIALRNKIEHRMCLDTDNLVTGRLQACCNNFNDALRDLLGEKQGLEANLSYSLQFATLAPEQIIEMKNAGDKEVNIAKFISDFDANLSDEIYADPRFSYRVLLVPRTTNKKGQSDHVIETIQPGSQLAADVNKVLLKEIGKEQYLPEGIVKIMKDEGFRNFKIQDHTELWRSKSAKDPKKGYGNFAAGKHWFWYKNWLEEVRKHCNENKEKYQ